MLVAKPYLNQDGVPDDGSDKVLWSTGARPPAIARQSIRAPAGLPNAQWVDSCSTAHAYQFDNPSSDWTCSNSADELVNYKITFCPKVAKIPDK
jgi:hypothetical protein